MRRRSSLLILACLVIACVAEVPSRFNSRGNLGGWRLTATLPSQKNAHILEVLRGGSTEKLFEANDGGATIGDDKSDDEAEDPVIKFPTQPVRLLIQTNWGNSVLDQQVEMMAARTRNVASLKKSLSRLLPGKPPILGLELVAEGRVLHDNTLVGELFDDDDDEEEEDDVDGSSRTLILCSVPPVDPKFATELAPKLRAHVEDDAATLSTDELLQAYFLNQAAMSQNGQLLANPTMESTPLLRLEVQQQASKFREQLKAEIPQQVWESSLQPSRKTRHTDEYRGQRYRSGKGGARTNLKMAIQHNLNIHWGETIRNFLLFLFFGYFGGRNSVSRYLMLWGAPLCFILQARPVKMWSKTLFYMMVNPPGIVLSLLPAPQQAILNLNWEKSYAALYSSDEGDETASSDDQTSGDNSAQFEAAEASDSEHDSDEESNG